MLVVMKFKRLPSMLLSRCKFNSLKLLTKTFGYRETLNDLIKVDDGGESLIYAACLLYPDLVKELIEKVAKPFLTSDLRKSYFNGYQSAKWADMLGHELFRSLDEEPLVYPWLMKSEKGDVDSDV